jgi:hypothetical protein
MLTPEAEAFRAKLAASRSSSSSFEAWIQSQRGRQLATWLITLAFLSPGLLCFVFGAPSSVSFGLELAGFAINAWLRRERRRRRAEILAWTEPDAGESEDAPGFATGAAQPF